MNFDLHRLRLLRELYRRGTIKAVAEALAYSPAAVSQQLAVLQKEVGARLIEPDGRRVRLTPQAHILIEHTEAVLDRLQQAEADLSRSQIEVSGRVQVAAFQTAMLVLVPRALTWLRQHHPALRIEVIQSEQDLARATLLPHDVDLVIDEVYPEYPRAPARQLHQQLLVEDPIRLADTDPTRHQDGITAYAHVPWVMEPPGSPAREWTLSVCRQAGFEPDIVYESTDMVIHLRLIENGHAVALLPDLLWVDQPARVHLHQLASAHQRRIVTACRASARTNPAIIALRRALRLAAANPHQAPSSD